MKTKLESRKAKAPTRRRWVLACRFSRPVAFHVAIGIHPNFNLNAP